MPKIGETSPRLNTAAAIGTQTSLLDFKDMSNSKVNKYYNGTLAGNWIPMIDLHLYI